MSWKQQSRDRRPTLHLDLLADLDASRGAPVTCAWWRSVRGGTTHIGDGLRGLPDVLNFAFALLCTAGGLGVARAANTPAATGNAS